MKMDYDFVKNSITSSYGFLTFKIQRTMKFSWEIIFISKMSLKIGIMSINCTDY